jgi:hypothetical protein
MDLKSIRKSQDGLQAVNALSLAFSRNFYKYKILFFFFFNFFPLYFYGFLCIYLCRPPEASTRYCAIPGGYPPED